MRIDESAVAKLVALGWRVERWSRHEKPEVTDVVVSDQAFTPESRTSIGVAIEDCETFMGLLEKKGLASPQPPEGNGSS